MRFGIVCNDSHELSDFLNRSRLEVLWAVMANDSHAPVRVYDDLQEALAFEPVDALLDATGQVQDAPCPIFDANTALFLLGAGRRQASGEGDDQALASTVSQINKGIDNITEQIEAMQKYCQALTQAGLHLDNASKGIIDALERTSSMLDSITRIAKRSKIIGLNSAIEASRVGESGRGFVVVAEEIKNLADDSSRSVREIDRVLTGIQRKSHEFAKSIDSVKDVSQLQQQSTQQIGVLLDSVRELAMYLRQLADDVA